MAEKKYVKVGGQLQNIVGDGTIAKASEIKDETKNKFLSQINAEVDTTLANHESIIEGLNSQTYVTVTATEETTDVTDVLPSEDQATDTVYRVGCWNGTEFDESSYSEYAWNGSAYVHVSTKTQIGEVFDISAYHASGGELATYDDLTDALDGGNNIPQSLRKGGMKVQFIQTSDNKYVQYRLMSDTFNTTPANWQGVDDEFIAGSKNLAEIGSIVDYVSEPKKYITPVKNLGSWQCKFNGTSSKASLYSDIILSQEGDSIEFEITNQVTGEDINAAGFAHGGLHSLIAAYGGFINIRTETESSNHFVYSGSPRLTKIKLVWGTDVIRVYLNGSTTPNATTIPLSTLKISEFGNNTTYWWKGIIKSIKVNGTAYSLIDNSYMTDVDISRVNGFLTDEQQQQITDIEQNMATKNDLLPYEKTLTYTNIISDLGGWQCDFNGTSSKAALNNPITLSQEGDSIEFEITNKLTNNNDTRAVGFAIGGNNSRIWVYYSYVHIATETETHDFYTSGVVVSKFKLVWGESGISVYVNDVLSTYILPTSTLNISQFGNRTTYWWYGIIKSIKLNGTTFNLQDNAKLINVEVHREGTFLTDEQHNLLTKPRIVFRKKASNKFYLDVLDTKSMKYLTHIFNHQYYTKTLVDASNNVHENYLCGDVWLDTDIYDTATETSGHYIMQGNTNFIYKIDPALATTNPTFANESSLNGLGHVGAYHGGVIQQWTKFFIDGVEIDLSNNNQIIEGTTFRFIEKVNCYAVDITQEGCTSERMTLKLDANGNKILAAVHYLDALYEPNNHISIRNKLTIKRDGTKFYQCFGAMLEGQRKFFDEVTINNAEDTLNGWTYSNSTTPVITLEGGSLIDLDVHPYQFADTAEMFGKGIFVKQSMMQFDNSRRNISNMHTLFYKDGVPRLKIYQLPCICTIDNVTLGEEAETFNDGDTLEVFIDRKIEINTQE